MLPRLIPIEVGEYDPNWIKDFEDEAAALTNVFAPRLLEIHHVGSTSVPNLVAKPIIDILVTLDDTSDTATASWYSTPFH